jgi:hypothetical protein
MSSVESELNASIAQGIEAKAEAAEAAPPAAAEALPAVSPKGTSVGASPERTFSEPEPAPDKPAA